MMSVEDQYPPNGHLPSVASHEAPMTHGSTTHGPLTHGSTTHRSMTRGTA